MASAPQTPDGTASTTAPAETEQVSRAPGMIASAVILLAAAASIVLPHLVDVAVWVRLAGLVLGLVLIAVGSIVFAQELRRQSVLRR